MEIWKGLIYQGYDYSDILQVSNKGNIRNIKTGTIYKWVRTQKGYLTVTISLGNRNNRKNFKAHRCVAETFIKNDLQLKEINHKDGNKENNCVENLEWCTRQYNNLHALKMGLRIPAKREKQGLAKLNEKDVQYIRENYKAKDKKFGCRALAQKFNVCHKSIEQIINNKTWII